MSLRIIEFFVEIYAKDRNVTYDVGDTEVNVYESYHTNQRRYRKRCFDPFRRGGAIEWCVKGKTFKSNVRQLCFMRWAIENKVLDYIDEHYDDITSAMKDHKCCATPTPTTSSTSSQYIVTRSKSRIKIVLKFG
jgi:hypothetical protein